MVPVSIMTTCAITAEPIKVPVITKTPIRIIFHPCFAKVFTWSPMEIPAYAPTMVRGAVKLILPTASITNCLAGEIGDAAKYNRRLAEKKKWQYMGTAQIVMPVHIVWHASAIARRKLSNMERRALENHAIIWIDKCKEILRILFYIFNNCLL